MKLNFEKLINSKGEIIYYIGNPNLSKLEMLSIGCGDVWHSSLDQGFANAFSEIVYQSALYWYINDFENQSECVSWRINPNAFAVRKSVWETLGGFDQDFENLQMQALDFGYRCNRFLGAVTLFETDLFENKEQVQINICAKDRYVFYRKNFKIMHSFLMLFRIGFWKIKEWQALHFAYKNYSKRTLNNFVLPKKLKPLVGNPTVSYIIPTMLRQEFTAQLLSDLAAQSLIPKQVIIVDATPTDKRKSSIYGNQYPFELQVHWQKSKGSCRARNEAIACCTSDYIIFGDDDIRIGSEFVSNHIRFLQTNNADACNGLDIQADHYEQNLKDLDLKLLKIGPDRLIAGCAQSFSNANSCVARKWVNKLVGNDVNFDGGYGEDSDFGMALTKIGVTVLYNPFSVNLHLKPPLGGYRFWGSQAKILGKKRKSQPWEIDVPVRWVKPVPSPTVMYGILKNFNAKQLIEYKYKHFFHYLFKGSKIGIAYRILRIPYKLVQFERSVFYAKKLINRGIKLD